MTETSSTGSHFLNILLPPSRHSVTGWSPRQWYIGPWVAFKVLDIFKVANTQEKQRGEWFIWVQCSRLQYLVVLLRCYGCGEVEHHPSRPRDGRCCSPQGGWKAEQWKEARSLEQVHSSIVDSRDLFPPVRSGFPIFSSPPNNGIELQIRQPIHEARALAAQSLCCNAYL